MTLPSLDPDFDARWAAWVARGRAHDRQVRRKLVWVVPLGVVMVLALVDLFFR